MARLVAQWLLNPKQLVSEVTAQIHTEGLSTSSQFDIFTTLTQASALCRRHCVSLQDLKHATVALQLTDSVPLGQKLCMRHLILRSAFLGDVHFDQEVVFFSDKHRWNVFKMSCAMLDSHSAHIRCCWNPLLWIDATPVLQTLELQTWSVYAVQGKLEHDPCNPPWEDDWPLWSTLFLTACLTFLVTVTSLQCVFCVSTANGDWLVGQLLPYHVTSSRSYLCCSVRCSMCSHPSPSHTQAFGKLLILLQEDRYWKVVWFLPNRTAPCIFSKTLLSRLICSQQTILHRPGCIWSLLLSCHRMKKADTETRKAAKVAFAGLCLNSQVMALQLMDNLPLRRKLCMRHLILRSAFLGDVHFDQEVVFFSDKHRWNMVKVSCAMLDSHSAHIRCCWNPLLWIDATPVLQTLELQTWSVYAVQGKLEHDPCNPPWEDDWPLWSTLFLTACLTFLVTVTSLQCVFCVVLKDCWRADVSTANEDWLVGQLLPYHVTSSRSYLCCSVRCSICSHPSPSHTQAFGKLLILLQEDRYWKVVSVVSAQPHRTFNFQQDSSEVVWFLHSKWFYTGPVASCRCCSAVTEWKKRVLRPERLRR